MSEDTDFTNWNTDTTPEPPSKPFNTTKYLQSDIGRCVIMWNGRNDWRTDKIRAISEDGELVCLYEPKKKLFWRLWRSRYQQMWYHYSQVFPAFIPKQTQDESGDW